MRILVLGGNGMLGHKLCQTLSGRVETWATFRQELSHYENIFPEILPKERMIAKLDVREVNRLADVLDSINPDAVVNAAGIVKQRDEAKHAIASIQVNALFPHQLANLCRESGIRVIQVSTDCVFSGLRGSYTEADVPDPVDLYGRTKLLGELNQPHCLTLRTSIIGWQLNTFSSLLSWFALQRGKQIKGYHQAIYSGFSTSVLSMLIADILETRPDLSGLYHVASDPISKYDLLLRLRDELGWQDITINPDEHFHCDRSLVAKRFTTATGWVPPTWDKMIADLGEEWSAYQDVYNNLLEKKEY